MGAEEVAGGELSEIGARSQENGHGGLSAGGLETCPMILRLGGPIDRKQPGLSVFLRTPNARRRGGCSGLTRGG